MNAKETLKFYFGYDSFREGQEDIINSILNGKDLLAIMPTGGGKSICFQIPALMFSGITLVISPLISLMQDQVKSLQQLNINASCINSAIPQDQINDTIRLVNSGFCKIIYVAPERLEFQDFIEFAKQVDISMVAVDEAHCISRWGQDFRPSYLNIIQFINNLSKRPIITAFTATATEEIKNDIVETLNLNQPEIFVTGYDRKNLYYKVEEIPRMRLKINYIVKYIKKHPKDSGIIYCYSRSTVEKVTTELCSHNIPATRYHAGMENDERKKNQEDFTHNIKPIIVATNAFGMGIDKPNVRFVIHYNMPKNMEDYYQEAGRAGRDGLPADCIILFNRGDISLINALLESNKNNTPEIQTINPQLIQERNKKRLQSMTRYCETNGCLRNFILRYFGEHRTASCNNCGNCNLIYDVKDMTKEALTVIQCVMETGNRYGITKIIQILRGMKSSKLKNLGVMDRPFYGYLKNYSDTQIRNLIYQMIEDNYLKVVHEGYSNSNMIYQILKIGEKSEVDLNEMTFNLREPKKGNYNDLFENLREIRTEITNERSLNNPENVCSNAILKDICLKKPGNEEEFLKIPGITQEMFNDFGSKFLDEIMKLQPSITSFKPTNTLTITSLPMTVKKQQKPIDKLFKRKREENSDSDGSSSSKNDETVRPNKKRKLIKEEKLNTLISTGYDLLSELLNLRMEISNKNQIPLDSIFSNTALIDMCIKQPANENELLMISEVNQNQLHHYGQPFLEIINKYRIKRQNLLRSMADDINNRYYKESMTPNNTSTIKENHNENINNGANNNNNNNNNINNSNSNINGNYNNNNNSNGNHNSNNNIIININNNNDNNYNNNNNNDNSSSSNGLNDLNQFDESEIQRITDDYFNNYDMDLDDDKVNDDDNGNNNNDDDDEFDDIQYDLTREEEESLIGISFFNDNIQDKGKKPVDDYNQDKGKNPIDDYNQDKGKNPIIDQVLNEENNNEEQQSILFELTKEEEELLLNFNDQDLNNDEIEEQQLCEVTKKEEEGFLLGNNINNNVYNSNSSNQMENNMINNYHEKEYSYNNIDMNKNPNFNNEASPSNKRQMTDSRDDFNTPKRSFLNHFDFSYGPNQTSLVNNKAYELYTPSSISPKSYHDYSPLQNLKKTGNNNKFSRHELFKSLKILRDEIAKDEQINAEDIINIETLVKICKIIPLNKEDLLKIEGVDYNTVCTYGHRFLKAIQDFLEKFKHLDALFENTSPIYNRHENEYELEDKIGINFPFIDHQPVTYEEHSRSDGPSFQQNEFVGKYGNSSNNQQNNRNLENGNGEDQPITTINDLLNSLKRLRMEIAREENVSPYSIFTDNALQSMCKVLPDNEKEFLYVHDVDIEKCRKYGDRFIKIIKKF